jgi:antitoxin HigA-1
MKKLLPVHPGEILREEFIKPMGQSRLAKAMRVPPPRVNEIVHEKRAVTADSALRFARLFDVPAEFWLHLQARYDLECEKARLGQSLAKQIDPHVCHKR